MYRLQGVTVTFLLLFFSSTLILAVAQDSVGVRKGNWIEYDVTIQAELGSGLSEEHNVTWARIEVTNVEGTAITLSVQTKYSNSAILSEAVTLDLSSGELGDDFVIPANLNEGDVFKDLHQGIMLIQSVEQKTVAGSQRNIISVSTSETVYFWDQASGILVEANTTAQGYNMRTIVIKTNIWDPSVNIFSVTFWAIVAVIFFAVFALGTIMVRSRRRQRGDAKHKYNNQMLA